MRLQPCGFIVEPTAVQGGGLRGQMEGITKSGTPFSLRLAAPHLLARDTGAETLTKKMSPVRNERGLARCAMIESLHVSEGREEDKTKKIRKDLCEKFRRKSRKNTAFSNRQFHPIFEPATATASDFVYRSPRVGLLQGRTRPFFVVSWLSPGSRHVATPWEERHRTRPSPRHNRERARRANDGGDSTRFVVAPSQTPTSLEPALTSLQS